MLLLLQANGVINCVILFVMMTVCSGINRQTREKLVDTERLKQIVAQYVEAFEKADIEIIRAIYAEDATLEDPVGTEVKQGMPAICDFYESAFAGGAKLEMNGEVRCAGNSVAFPFTVIVGGMKIHPIDVFEINADGKIQSMKAYWSAENMG